MVRLPIVYDPPLPRAATAHAAPVPPAPTLLERLLAEQQELTAVERFAQRHEDAHASDLNATHDCLHAERGHPGPRGNHRDGKDERPAFDSLSFLP